MTPKEKDAIRDMKIEQLLSKVELLLALAIASPSEKKGLISAIKSGEVLDG